MSRKHFIALAETLKTQNASAELCRELAYEFKKINPNFCIYKFLSACGI